MRKKLIAAIVVVLILLCAAIGVVVYLENADPSGQPDASTPDTSAVETEPSETEEPVETTEETVGISLPTENPDEVAPEVTFDPDDTTPVQTVDPNGDQDSDATEDPDENETPAMPL